MYLFLLPNTAHVKRIHIFPLNGHLNNTFIAATMQTATKDSETFIKTETEKQYYYLTRSHGQCVSVGRL